MKEKPLWKCPKCGRNFAHHNQLHTCGHFTVKELLDGNNPRSILLYERFEEMVKKCGPVTVEPTKTRIGFKLRITFAAVSLNRYGLNAHVVLPGKIESPRFSRVETHSSKNHVHHFRIKSINELNDEVQSWLRAAYESGK